ALPTMGVATSRALPHHGRRQTEGRCHTQGTAPPRALPRHGRCHTQGTAPPRALPRHGRRHTKGTAPL
ncbi:hypothetical protein HDU79_001757, partial [Rhizoclosmatium sp. JEL0117]